MDYKFVHFGCWNNLNKENHVERVVQKIKKRKLNFMVVAGDNYYPNKFVSESKKVKIINKEKLIRGFKILPKDVEINMILGNHDLETNVSQSEPDLFIEDKDKTNREKDCFILETEKEEAKENKKINFKIWDKKVLGSTLILMIDTSMYADEKNVEEYMPCYQKYFKDITKEALLSNQQTFIVESIKNHPSKLTDLIIIGHHPIIAVKSKASKKKKDKDSKKSTTEENKLHVLDDIPHFHKVLKDIKTAVDIKNTNNASTMYHYLCADLHLYQEGVVTIDGMEIHQYIVGTGGADLDDEIPPEAINKKYENGDIAYSLIKTQRNFGYLECENKSSKWNFKFVSVEEQGTPETKTVDEGSRKSKSKPKRKRYTKKIILQKIDTVKMSPTPYHNRIFNHGVHLP